MHRFYKVLCAEHAHALNSCGLLWQSYGGGQKVPCTIPRGRVLSWWERELKYHGKFTAYYKLLEY